MAPSDPGAERRARLAGARLYLVCPSIPAHGDAGERDLHELLRAAVAGGVDIVQLRDKEVSDAELLPVISAARALCEELGVLFIVNDRPQLARDVDADGIHVGQEDMPVEEVRGIVGEGLLIGLSTHAPSEIDAVQPVTSEGAFLVDYIGVGPIHETPTKPGRPAVGQELVRHAAAHSPVPFFAIGGLHAANLHETIHAGARRVCVLRAISQAEDPEAAARELSELLPLAPEGLLQ
jgi:thiamine-phosphate pyrophosphorylase